MRLLKRKRACFFFELLIHLEIIKKVLKNIFFIIIVQGLIVIKKGKTKSHLLVHFFKFLYLFFNFLHFINFHFKGVFPKKKAL
jgi:hypothetical protein